MIKEKINDDIKTAMRNKDNHRRDALRFLKSKIQQVEVDSRKEADDEVASQVIKKLIKQNKDSLTYDPSDKEKILYEISAWGGYLPLQLSSDELEVEIKKIIEEKQVSSIKGMGIIMSALKESFGASVDMGVASRVAKGLLA